MVSESIYVSLPLPEVEEIEMTKKEWELLRVEWFLKQSKFLLTY